MAWRPPELPPVQKMPTKRPAPKASVGGRVIAGIAGMAFLVTAAVGVLRAFRGPGGASAALPSLGILLPAILFLRYAATGQFKIS
jgi:hypothetical protein